MTATPPIVDRETWQKQNRHAARQGEGAHPRGDAIAEARWRLPMVEVDPTSAVVGAAGEVPLIDTFQEPVAAVCVGVRRRVRLRDRPGRVCDVDLIWEQVVVDAHDPVALGRWWAEALGWVVVGDTADELSGRLPDRVPGLLFVPVPEEKAGKNRLHLDFRPVDQTAEVERLLSLGARRVDVGQRDASWVVLADPEGNEFCVLSGQVRPDS
jgi:hypothetical protein